MDCLPFRIYVRDVTFVLVFDISCCFLIRGFIIKIWYFIYSQIFQMVSCFRIFRYLRWPLALSSAQYVHPGIPTVMSISILHLHAVRVFVLVYGADPYVKIRVTL